MNREIKLGMLWGYPAIKVSLHERVFIAYWIFDRWIVTGDESLIKEFVASKEGDVYVQP